MLAQWALLRLTRGADEGTVQLLHEAVQALVAEGMLWWLADALAWVPAHQRRWPDALRLLAWSDGLVQQRGEQRGPLFAAVRRHWDGLFGGHLRASVVDASVDVHLDETSALALAFCAPGPADPAPAAVISATNSATNIATTGALRYRASHG